MKKYIGISLTALALSSGPLFGGQINWGIDGGNATYSNGSPFGSEFTIQLGTFASGFSPDSSNVDLWGANFLTGGIDNNSNTWNNWGNATYPNYGDASGSLIFRGGGDVAQNDVAFMWGYNSLDIANTSEWVLLSNTAWTFPQPTPSGIALVAGNWNSSDAGTQMLFGGSFNHTTQSGLDAVISSQAIPEPSTYALIFGLGILGFLGFRRFRK